MRTGLHWQTAVGGGDLLRREVFPRPLFLTYREDSEDSEQQMGWGWCIVADRCEKDTKHTQLGPLACFTCLFCRRPRQLPLGDKQVIALETRPVGGCFCAVLGTARSPSNSCVRLRRSAERQNRGKQRSPQERFHPSL